MKEIHLEEFCCRIAIVKEGFFPLSTLVKSYSSAFVIADEAVAALYGREVLELLSSHISKEAELITFPSGEGSKSIAVASRLLEALVMKGGDRSSLIASLGGGVASDLVGFVASTFMRGVDLVHLPTTLLAMVDASIGGKTGVNLPRGKNLIGTFYHPKLIVMNLATLSSLPEREYRSGYAEVIKTAVLGDPLLYRGLERGTLPVEEVVYKTALIKAEIARGDEREEGERARLNYGHTFSHAIESSTGYTGYLHGEAVSIGMSAAAYVAKRLGFVGNSFVEEQDRLLRSYRLPIELPAIDSRTLIAAMRGDKKSRAGKIHLILPEKVGKVVKVADVAEELIFEAMEEKRCRDSLERD